LGLIPAVSRPKLLADKSAEVRIGFAERGDLSLAEQQAIVEENSAAYGKDATEKILNRATEEPYSFLWLNLRATKKEDLFWLKFTARLIPRGPDAGPDSP
jgi:hypothetical protein